MSTNQFFESEESKEQYIKAEQGVFEDESDREDTLGSDTWKAIKDIFKSFLPTDDAKS